MGWLIAEGDIFARYLVGDTVENATGIARDDVAGSEIPEDERLATALRSGRQPGPYRE